MPLTSNGMEGAPSMITFKEDIMLYEIKHVYSFRYSKTRSFNMLGCVAA